LAQLLQNICEGVKKEVIMMFNISSSSNLQTSLNLFQQENESKLNMESNLMNNFSLACVRNKIKQTNSKLSIFNFTSVELVYGFLFHRYKKIQNF